MTWKMAAMAAVLFAPAGVSLAQGRASGLSAKYTACQARAGGNTVQMGICAQTEMASQDARLNKSYQQVMRQLAATPARRIALRDEQRSWLKARDYDCKVDQETINSSCIVAKTALRADELESKIRF
ncbi:lysozyme inhibitor LprI family protein [Sphingomonas paeninsulae]|jgi:uncharacterized protein YecT (DUF1311 family)|nr:lysozyme inhibitor LprI family protein [Sphingomonas paeninsulae]